MAKTPKMDWTEKMEASSRALFHTSHVLSAQLDHQATRELPDKKDLEDPREVREKTEKTEKRDPKASKDHLDSPARADLLDPQARKVHQGESSKSTDLLDLKARLEAPDQPDRRAFQERTEPTQVAVSDLSVTTAVPAHQERPDHRDLKDHKEQTASQVAANTAHLLALLQAISLFKKCCYNSIIIQQQQYYHHHLKNN